MSVMAHAFNYGTACFEGIRGYWSPQRNQMFVFKVREHFERLLRSCRVLCIRPRHSAEELVELTRELLRKNGDREDVYVRPIYYKSAEAIGVKLGGLDDDFTMFSVPFGPYLDLTKGLRVRVSSWRHVDDNAIPMRSKICGAYVNAALAKTEALDDGYDEAIFLSADGHVSEGSAENLFIVRGGKLITPPVTQDILEGITRETIIELAAAELHLETVERPLDRTELYIAEEAFFVGTGAQVSPIAEIDRRPVGSGGVGTVTKRIQDLYMAVVHGQESKYLKWCTPVYP